MNETDENQYKGVIYGDHLTSTVELTPNEFDTDAETLESAVRSELEGFESTVNCVVRASWLARFGQTDTLRITIKYPKATSKDYANMASDNLYHMIANAVVGGVQ